MGISQPVMASSEVEWPAEESTDWKIAIFAGHYNTVT